MQNNLRKFNGIFPHFSWLIMSVVMGFDFCQTFIMFIIFYLYIAILVVSYITIVNVRKTENKSVEINKNTSVMLTIYHTVTNMLLVYFNALFITEEISFATFLLIYFLNYIIDINLLKNKFKN